MAIAGLDLNRIGVFVHVAEAGGVTAAATRLRVTKSSVSRSLTQLEADLGVELVSRGNGAFELTDAGRDLYEAAAAGFASVDAARLRLQESHGAARGLVRVAAPPVFAALLAPAVARFLREHPAVEVALVSTGRPVQLRDGFDLVVALEKPVEAAARVRALGAVETGLFASPGYLAARAAPRVPADLARHEVILVGTGEPRWSLDGPGGTATVDIAGRLRVDDVVTASAAANADGGVVALPVHYQSVEAPALVRVLPEWKVRSARAELVYRASRHEPVAVRLLREAIVTATNRCR